MSLTTSRSFTAEFAADVARDLSLSPKQLQSKYLYDPLGSSLFEAICRLPWYRITRAETRLLAEYAGAIVSALGAPEGTIVELGCGSGEKIVLLAEALAQRGTTARVHLIDISTQALEQSEQRLNRLRHVSVVGHWSTYEEGLRRAVSQRRTGSTMLVLLLGSNIGNFDQPAAARFLERIRAALGSGDLLLLGADLVKPESDLLLAYDDPLGVTAAFNKNLLVRINRELGGTFDLDQFSHRAVWNREERRIEMHLVSRIDQSATIRASGTTVQFRRNEPIWTESSYKYEPDGIVELGAEAGFATADQWIDEEARFALTLLAAM
jgi:dimethylhistidine N-methyltransferase